MSSKTNKKVAISLLLLANMAFAQDYIIEEKIMTYKVPSNVYNKIIKDAEIVKKIKEEDKIKIKTHNSKYEYITHNGVTIIMNKNRSKKENFNTIIELLLKYKDEVPGIDSNFIKSMLENLMLE